MADPTYIARDDLKSTLQLQSTDTFADADIDVAIAAASRAIEWGCKRRFWKDSADQVRYYERTDRVRVRIDDLVSITSLRSDPTGEGTYPEEWIEGTDYVFGPPNADQDNRPWEMIYRLFAGNYIGPPDDEYLLPVGRYFLPLGPRRIQVTGIFGWPAVPDQVVQATTIMAARYLRRAREAPFSVVGMGFDGTTVRIPQVDPDVMHLLTGLRRHRPGENGMGIA